MHHLIILFITLTIFVMVGCISSLKDTINISRELKELRLSISDPYGNLATAIKQQLDLNNIKLVNENIHNLPILKIMCSSEDIETVSINQDGKSAEKQLNFYVNAQMILPNGIIFPIKTHISQSIFDDSLKILAKDVENEFIKKEILEQTASQLIFKLLIIHNNFRNKHEN
ncbi:MAG: LPS assembly lipoprotein LptE [Arsenophonus sp. ER-BJ3-MAG3]